MKNILIVLSCVIVSSGLRAESVKALPLLERPANCIVSTILNPDIGLPEEARDEKNYDHDKIFRDIKRILRKKGYVDTSEVGCGSAPEGASYFHCFGSNNNYLSMSIGYSKKSAALKKGAWPTSLNVTVYRRSESENKLGYYYNMVLDDDLAKFQKRSYYDQLVLYEVSKIPRCKNLRLQYTEPLY